VKKIVMILSLMMVTGVSALAQESDKMSHDMKMPQMTAEQRTKMADAHEKMAACLRSDKPIGDCHAEMKKSCEESMGKDGCPMMKDGMMGMHHNHKMKSDSSSAPTN